jgi:hypothetical protein
MQGLDLQIGKLIADADSGNVVRQTRSIIKLCRDAKVAIDMVIKPDYVGIHPSNRDGLGVNALDVHALLSDIADVGFSADEVHAVCMEANAAGQTFTMQIMDASGGKLPQYERAETIKYCSLAGSHTNQALRCIVAGTAGNDARLCTDGAFNLQKVEQHDHAMAQACIHGLRWLVLPSRLFDTHPTLGALLQSGFNCSNQISRSESELQVLRRLHSSWVQQAARVGDANVDYATIRSRVLRSKPPCSASLPFMYGFMLKTCGGVTGALMADTESYLKNSVTTTKVLGPDLFDILGQDVKGQTQQYVLLRHGLLKLAYCQNLTVGEAKKIHSKDREKQCLEAESLIAELRKVCEPFSASASVFAARHEFEMALTAYAIGRKSVSASCLAHQFIGKLCQLTNTTITSRFEAECANELAQIVQSSSTSNASHSKRANKSYLGLHLLLPQLFFKKLYNTHTKTYSIFCL